MNSLHNRFPMLTYKLPWHDLVHVFHTLSATRTARLPFFWVHKDTYKCVEKKNQLDATEWFIALIICSTCFGHFYAHRQELETICVITAHGVRCLGCWLLEVRCRAAGYAFGMRDVAQQHPSSRMHSRLPWPWPPTTSNQGIAHHGQ